MSSHPSNLPDLDQHPQLIEMCLSCTNLFCSGTCDRLKAKRTELSVECGYTKAAHGSYRRNAKLYEWHGEMLTLTQIAALNNTTYRTLDGRLRIGMTLEQAVQKAADGRKCRTTELTEAARISGISKETLRWRVRHGMTLEQAMNVPPMRKVKGEKNNESV